MAELAKWMPRWMQSRWRASRARQRCFARPKCWEGWRAGREACRATRGGGGIGIEPTTPCKDEIGVDGSCGGPIQTGERGARASDGGGAASGRECESESDASGAQESRDAKYRGCWGQCCRQASSCCGEDRGRDCCWVSSANDCGPSARREREQPEIDEAWSRR